MFLYNQLNQNLLNNFKEYFITTSAQHDCNTRGNDNQTIRKITMNIAPYGLHSNKYVVVSDWNNVSKDTVSKISQRSELEQSLKEQIFNACC